MAIHRYKANESGSKKTTNDKPKKVASVKAVEKPAKKLIKAKEEKVLTPKKQRKLLAPFRAIKEYFVGSWHELKQVRWPNRKQTWTLTIAVIFFSLLLGAVIFFLDLGFVELFKKVIF